MLWAFFWFLSLVLGVVLYVIYVITRSAADRHPMPGAPPGVAPGAPVAPMARPVQPGSAFPAYPRPANSGPIGAAPEGTILPAPPSAPIGAAPSPAGSPPPPAWYPDPGGRYHFRWWNGTEWTSQVSVHGQHLVDSSPDQRIGPYGS